MQLKLVTKVLVARINKVLSTHKGEILNPQQYAGVKGGSTIEPLFIRQAVAEQHSELGEE